jgi:hypothetical protein
MSRSQAKLRSVPATTEPAPDTSYEAEQRQRIMSRDWPSVHIAEIAPPRSTSPTG